LADLLEDGGDVRVRRGVGWQKTRLQALDGTIDKDALEEDKVIVEIQIETAAKALQKRHRTGLHGGPCRPMPDRLIDIKLSDGAADDGMNLGGEFSRRRHPVAQGNGYRDHPLPRGHPRDHLLDEMGGLLRHAPAGTRGAKASFLTAERQQHLVGTGVTPQADKAMG
jgi:hypothetical protein